jgi:hypothetical protein
MVGHQKCKTMKLQKKIKDEHEEVVVPTGY